MSGSVLAVVLALGFLAWFVLSSRRGMLRREKELTAFAERGGFQQEQFAQQIGNREVFVSYRDFWPDLAGEFHLSGREGVRLTVDHVLRKTWDGGKIVLFDYTTNNSNAGRAALFESDSLDLPRFTVRPGDLGSFSEWAARQEGVAMLGGIAILTADRARIERLFTPEVLAFFQARQPGGRTWAEGNGHRLLYYKLSDISRVHAQVDFPADAGIDGFWAGAQDVIRLITASPLR